MKRLTFCMAAAGILVAALAAFAPAWPELPPDRVWISGPGLIGQVEVTDRDARLLFRLGQLEDLHSSASGQPQGEAYHILRKFYDGTFDFARLAYYPDPNGGRGMLYWDDGPMLEGNHTPYHQRWLYANRGAEDELRALLKQLGASLNSAPAANPQPQPAASQRNADASGQPTTALSLNLVAAFGLVMALSLVAAAIRLWQHRQASRAN